MVPRSRQRRTAAGGPADRAVPARLAVSARARGRTRHIARRLLQATLVALALLIALLGAGAVYVIMLPSVGNAERRVERILTLHHGTYSGPVPPARLGDAVVAVEDEHFYSNVVVNVLTGAGRAALAALQTSQDPGGSTIAQQLAKQLYGHGRGLAATLREIGLGVKLSLHYSKAQVLDMYLNAVYYGHGYWGDSAAARGYFGTVPDRLDWAQASMLAGLLQAPTVLDPLEHYARAKQRQRHVLHQLVANHYLTRARAERAFTEPLHLV